MVQILYYFIVKPLSLLPMWILYRLADVLFILTYYVIGYRKEVVKENLFIAFPEMSEVERKQLARGFYKNFCDVFIESLKLFSISEKELSKRMIVHDVDNLKPYFDQGRSIVGLISHVSNWEWMVISDKVLSHRSLGIMTPLSNKFLHKKVVDSRTKFGCRAIPKAEVKKVISETTEPTVYFFASDQSPHRAKSAYWTKFFGRYTAVQYGAEKFAKEYDMPVFHFRIRRVKRGYYEVYNTALELNPVESSYGSILETYCIELEEHIRNNKTDWLWTHRRWKHTKPDESLATN